MRFFVLFLLGCMCLSLCKGQSAASRWVIGNGYGLDFRTQPPTVDSSGYQATLPHISSVCDNAGNLLFYTDGTDAWNASHQLINHVQMANPDPEWVLIVPQPQSSRYYIFSAQTANGFSRSQYAVIDMAANGGQGALVEPLQVLTTTIGQDWTIAAQGFCNGSLYWVILSNPSYVNQTGSVILSSYRLDSQGFHLTPVVTYPAQTAGFNMSNALALRFSPNGSKVAFRSTGIVSADFNPQTGVFSHFERVDQASTGYYFEFSPSGRYLYATEVKGSVGVPGDSLYSTLSQYDMQAGASAAIQASKVQLHLGEPLAALQTGPDGKIYMLKERSDLFTPSLSVIQHPDLPGLTADFVLDALPLPNRSPNTYATWVPMLPNNLVFNAGQSITPAFAGPDQVVCPGEPALLGTSFSPVFASQWDPVSFLSQPQSSPTDFLYPFDLYQDSTFSYVLGVQVDYCYYEDTVLVTVKRKPLPPVIAGIAVVCPGSEGVVYRVRTPQDSVVYSWEINGGTLVASLGDTAIVVDWGSVAGNGFVRVTPSFPGDCVGDPVVFPVKISPKLEPGLPAGPAEVCIEKKDKLLYQVAGAPGTTYAWRIEGGIFVGQPSPGQVLVSWNGVGVHRLWVEVKLTTSDTVCAGTSDTLLVEVFSDTGSVALSNVSTIYPDEHQIQLDFHQNTDRLGLDSLTIWRREPGMAWELAGRVDAASLFLFDSGRLTDDTPYEYQLATGNSCRTPIVSEIHRTVLLTAVSDSVADEVRLQWTPYQGWPVRAYELLDKPAGSANYAVIGTFSPDSTATVLKSSNSGFEHQYRIRAVSAAELRSLSNEVEAFFTRDLFIPNVFTPNGDHFQDQWVIRKIEYYPDNRLRIFDRWGRQVFSALGYRNDWAGSDLAEGVYFYHLSPGPGQAAYKGTVTLLR